MIGTFLFGIAGTLIGLLMEVIVFTSTLFVNQLPTEFAESITYFMSFLLQFDGYYNVIDTLEAIIWFLEFIFFFYLFLATKYLWAHMPWTGTSNEVRAFGSSGEGGNKFGGARDQIAGRAIDRMRAKVKFKIR